MITETIIPPADVDTLAPPEILDQILERARRANGVQIIGHVRPDGDCIGSMLGVHHLLVHWGIPHAMAAAKMNANGYSKLPGFELIREKPDSALAPDLTVCVDCATAVRGPEGWEPKGDVINIDHHGTNTRYGTINWVEPRCSSVGEMMYYLLQRAELALTPELATALLVALMTDTGSFRFSNTGALQLLVAAKLVQAGAKPQDVATMAYGSIPLKAARLMGRVYEGIQGMAGGKIAWSEIRKEMLLEAGEDQVPEDLSDIVRNIQGVQVSLLFHEMPKGGIRVNLRSNGTADVSQLAAVWGGGGHKAASGLTIESGDYVTLRDTILRRAEEMFGGSDLQPKS